MMRSRTLPILLPLMGLLAVLVTGSAGAVELLDARVTAGAVPVLENAGSTVRLEQPQLSASGHPVFTVPEPGALWPLGSGLGWLALLHARRQRRVVLRASRSAGR